MVINELWQAIMTWLTTFGDNDVAQTPGLYYKKTARVGDIGPLDVRLNAHSEEAVENIPPFHIQVTIDGSFPGIVGIVGPNGGTIFASRTPGEDEDGLIEHFRNQPVRNPAQ